MRCAISCGGAGRPGQRSMRKPVPGQRQPALVAPRCTAAVTPRPRPPCSRALCPACNASSRHMQARPAHLHGVVPLGARGHQAAVHGGQRAVEGDPAGMRSRGRPRARRSGQYGPAWAPAAGGCGLGRWRLGRLQLGRVPSWPSCVLSRRCSSCHARRPRSHPILDAVKGARTGRPPQMRPCPVPQGGEGKQGRDLERGGQPGQAVPPACSAAG